MLNDNDNIRSVYLCLDNDEAGHKATKRMSDKLFTQGIESHVLVPIRKDWNEDLLLSDESEVSLTCQDLQL